MSYWLPYHSDDTRSNPKAIAPKPYKEEPEYIKGMGWRNGYPFRQFLSNVYHHLGDLSKIRGVQQLVHHYYLQNGSLGAKVTADRIRKFLR